MNEFNYQLWEERHEKIDEFLDKFDKRLKKVENRFLAIMTALCLNLIGVIITLLIIVMRLKS